MIIDGSRSDSPDLGVVRSGGHGRSSPCGRTGARQHLTLVSRAPHSNGCDGCRSRRPGSARRSSTGRSSMWRAREHPRRRRRARGPRGPARSRCGGGRSRGAPAAPRLRVGWPRGSSPAASDRAAAPADKSAGSLLLDAPREQLEHLDSATVANLLARLPVPVAEHAVRTRATAVRSPVSRSCGAGAGVSADACVNRLRIAAFLGVLGPWDPGRALRRRPRGITTYSILGADHGYELSGSSSWRPRCSSSTTRSPCGSVP